MPISAGFVGMSKFISQSLVYIDANIFVYFIEFNEGFSQKARAVFEAAQENDTRLITSEITTGECLYKPYKNSEKDIISKYISLFNGEEIETTPVDGEIIRQSAMYGGKLGLKLIDSIHYFSAINAGCRYFITNDAQFTSTPEMQVLQLKDF